MNHVNFFAWANSRNRSRRRESALISVIEEKSVECRRWLQICGFLNTP